MTPREFVDDMKVLELGGVGSKAVPNGLGGSRGQRPYQEFYDELYFTRDAPRPAPAPSSQARQQPGRTARPSPIPSFASANSVTTTSSGTGEKEKEKKKKK